MPSGVRPRRLFFVDTQGSKVAGESSHEKARFNYGAANRPGDQRLPRATDRLSAEGRDRGAERGHAGRHTARGTFAGREGPGQYPGGRHSGAGVPPTTLHELRRLTAEEIKPSPGSRWAKPLPKWRRRPAPSCMPLRPARWCRCSGSPATSLPTPGTAVDSKIIHRKHRSDQRKPTV